MAWEYHIDVAAPCDRIPFSVSQRRLRSRGGDRAKVRAARACALGRDDFMCRGVRQPRALTWIAPPARATGWRIAGLAAWAVGGRIDGCVSSTRWNPLFPPSRCHGQYRGAAVWLRMLVATVMIGIAYAAGSVRWANDRARRAPAVSIYSYICAAAIRPQGIRAEPRQEEDALRETLKDLRSIATVLFSLLVFFQFGNEWALAGWLPLFLIHRLGISPVLALGGTGVVFFVLDGRARHRATLARKLAPLANASGEHFPGHDWLSLAQLRGGLGGATVAITVIGIAYGPIFPLIAEQLDDRFSYRPAFYNGMIAIAVSGAMSAPWLLGYVDAYFGIQYVMLIPAFGSVAVLILALLLMLEARLMGAKHARQSESLIAGD